MEIEQSYSLDAHRRLCIKKDLIELTGWIDTLERVNEEINYLKIIDKQLIKDSAIGHNLQALRRKNTLLMGLLCSYEKELNTEYEYGKLKYDLSRAKLHEKKRSGLDSFVLEFVEIRKRIYHKLSMYHRR
ncbi:hypothetical protein C5O00_13255 [Pukyongia salina]|uniref:Uncharacterized protein n=1 Tax=Pukyongia salina TaxID=2094025 RepID=A0A2S0HZI3_9FLAO|nr:hypothetical protein [Pukyongia salina]AVI52069.1 hypothetical protein C5O00_13255 [Pukyongia salina]